MPRLTMSINQKQKIIMLYPEKHIYLGEPIWYQMRTKIQKIHQASDDSIRFNTTVPKSLVEAIGLEGTELEWKIIDRDNMELKVKRDNGHGKSKKAGSGN